MWEKWKTFMTINGNGRTKDKAELLSVKCTSVMFWLSPTRPGIICLHNQLFSLIAVFTTGHLWSASVCVKITHHHSKTQTWSKLDRRTEILQSTVMVLLVSEAPRCVSCRVTIKLETSYSSPPICHTWPDHNDYNYANVHINKTNRGTGQITKGQVKWRKCSQDPKYFDHNFYDICHSCF